MENMNLVIACDHAGYDYKNQLIKYLEAKGYNMTDVGTYSPESCDYPIPVHRLCEKITGGDCPRGILICGTGIGVSIAANKHPGIRAALCGDKYSAEMTRQHNNANVLCMGARVISFELACEITDIFLSTPALDEERHRRRVKMIEDLENGVFDESKYN